MITANDIKAALRMDLFRSVYPQPGLPSVHKILKLFDAKALANAMQEWADLDEVEDTAEAMASHLEAILDAAGLRYGMDRDSRWVFMDAIVGRAWDEAHHGGPKLVYGLVASRM